MQTKPRDDCGTQGYKRPQGLQDLSMARNSKAEEAEAPEVKTPKGLKRSRVKVKGANNPA